MAIEHFKRPFTDEEQVKLAKHIATALEDIQPQPIFEKRQGIQKVLDGGCFVSLMFFSLALLVIAGSQGWIWALMVGISLVLFWQ